MMASRAAARTAAIVGLSSSMRSKLEGWSASDCRRAAPKAWRSSVPMLNLRTPCRWASRRRVAGGMPLAPCSTSGTVDAFGLFLLQVHVADRDGEGINTGFRRKARGVFRCGKARTPPVRIAHEADFSFHRHARRACGNDDLPRQGNVVLQRQRGSVDHHRREAVLDPRETFLQ